MKTRLAIVVTHPIQHFVPFYRAIAADPDIELHVLYGAPIGVQSYYDEEMQTQITWNMDMLGGYSHEFLGEVPEGGQPGVRRPDSAITGKRLSAFKPDVVLVYGHMQANVFRAIWWCRRHKVPLMTIGDSELLRDRTNRDEGAQGSRRPRHLPALFGVPVGGRPQRRILSILRRAGRPHLSLALHHRRGDLSRRTAPTAPRSAPKRARTTTSPTMRSWRCSSASSRRASAPAT